MAKTTQLKKRARRVAESAADSDLLFYGIGAAGLGLLWWLWKHPRAEAQP